MLRVAFWLHLRVLRIEPAAVAGAFITLVPVSELFDAVAFGER